MTRDISWGHRLQGDVEFGYLDRHRATGRGLHPQVVLNDESSTMLRTLREELKRSDEFTFSVAFVSPRAIALLKQELLDFGGTGRIITSDYLGFNSPQAFAELHSLTKHGFDVRRHEAKAFHPKGYIFQAPDGLTAVVGSSNLTETALTTNHEWNLKVSASTESDLADQFKQLVRRQLAESIPLTEAWIEEYAETYTPPAPRRPKPAVYREADYVEPNVMQAAALEAVAGVRAEGKRKAIVISATGTGKTILSALDVRAMNPQRVLFVVHREQILDKTISEYQRVLGGLTTDYGKLTGTVKQPDRRYLFATVQTLSQPGVLERFAPDAFDYVLIDEAHRAGAAGHQRVLEHFTPKFLLGMTATPERTDGFNVFELFDYNVPYEIRLNHALEADMLAPFHYYGVADVTYADGTTTSDETDLKLLISPERVDHVVTAIDTYGQAGVPPRGLIFCSRKDEARALSTELNAKELRGRRLRTVALTGDDPIPHREAVVRQLEAGEIDYVLTVDIFNEGVDIPTVNQVIMLRQTQSAIVFVQQLGRGLRKADGKEYLVVIDFIGNYANNYLVPIALFGDESLNKESLRKSLIAAEETGVLPGLSSVRFDRISQERILKSITDTSLDSMMRLKAAIESMRNRVGGIPQLRDFFRFESVDPVVLATKKQNYPSLVQSVLREDANLTSDEHRALQLLSHEVLPSKRPHEFVLLDLLKKHGRATNAELGDALEDDGLVNDQAVIRSTMDTFSASKSAPNDRKKFSGAFVDVEVDYTSVALTPTAAESFASSAPFTAAVDDLHRTGRTIVLQRYSTESRFTAGKLYTRKDAAQLLCWPRSWTSTIYGYKAHLETGFCPIFVTLQKAEDVDESTAYEDALIDQHTMVWYSKNRRRLTSPDVAPIVGNRVELHVFAQRSEAEDGPDHFYLGQATAERAEETTIRSKGKDLPIVRMLLHFDRPVDRGLFDYFNPQLTN